MTIDWPITVAVIARLSGARLGTRLPGLTRAGATALRAAMGAPLPTGGRQ